MTAFKGAKYKIQPYWTSGKIRICYVQNWWCHDIENDVTSPLCVLFSSSLFYWPG